MTDVEHVPEHDTDADEELPFSGVDQTGDSSPVGAVDHDTDQDAESNEAAERDDVAAAATDRTAPGSDAERRRTGGFLPVDPSRRTAESVLVRLIATAGVIGIGTAIGAALGAYDVAAWIMGLVVSGVCVLLAALLWRSRTL